MKEDVTKEERALFAFLAAMRDQKLDRQEMRKAMLKALGIKNDKHNTDTGKTEAT